MRLKSFVCSVFLLSLPVVSMASTISSIFLGEWVANKTIRSLSTESWQQSGHKLSQSVSHNYYISLDITQAFQGFFIAKYHYKNLSAHQFRDYDGAKHVNADTITMMGVYQPENHGSIYFVPVQRYPAHFMRCELKNHASMRCMMLSSGLTHSYIEVADYKKSTTHHA